MTWNTTDPLAMTWSTKAWEALRDGALTAKVLDVDGILVAHLDGDCPRCAHPLSQRIPLTAVGTTARSVDTLGDAMADPSGRVEVPPLKDVDFTCDCSEPHENRPKDDAGCNTSFRLTLFVEERSAGGDR